MKFARTRPDASARSALLLGLVVLAQGCACNGKDDATTPCVGETGCAPTSGGTTADTSPVRSCEVVITFGASAGSVAVAGRFNEWEPADLTEVADGQWELSLGELVPGVYGHKFVIDGAWEGDPPPDVYTTWDDGFENRALLVPDCQLPELRALEGAATPDGTLSASFQFERAADGAAADPASLTVTVGGVDHPAELGPDGVITVSATGLAPGKHSVRVELRDTAGRAPESGAALIPLWVEPEPFDWADGALYFVFTDRFRDGGPDGQGPVAGAIRGTDWIGGDLVGAKQALDEGWFDALGVRSLWLSPVYDNPPGAYGGSFGYLYTGYHGYWPVNGRAVEERWGANGVTGDQALRELVDAAHARGIRVVLDTVMNHVHEDHVWVSQHPDWFSAAPCPCTSDPGPCNWDTNPLGCWFTDYLPDLDYRNRDVTSEAIRDLDWWVTEFDVDGFRVDAAKHMDHVILRSSRLHLAERFEQPSGVELYLVGETFTGQGGQGLINNYIAPYELSGQFDFPLLYPIRGIGTGGSFRTLATEVAGSEAVYGDAVHRMTVFLGNHDVARYATDLQGCNGYNPFDPYWIFEGCPDRLRDGDPAAMTGPEWDLVNPLSVSWAFVMTQPGPPLIYYGDEIGLAGAGDPDNRRPMPWGTLSLAQQTLLDRVRALGQLRRSEHALQVGSRRELWVDDDLYVYARDAGGGDVAIVALHKGAVTRIQDIPIPGDLGIDGAGFTDGLGGSRTGTVSGGSLHLELDPWEYVVFVR